MKKTIARLMSLALALVLAFSLGTTALAVNKYDPFEEEEEDAYVYEDDEFFTLEEIEEFIDDLDDGALKTRLTELLDAYKKALRSGDAEGEWDALVDAVLDVLFGEDSDSDFYSWLYGDDYEDYDDYDREEDDWDDWDDWSGWGDWFGTYTWPGEEDPAETWEPSEPEVPAEPEKSAEPEKPAEAPSKQETSGASDWEQAFETIFPEEDEYGFYGAFRAWLHDWLKSIEL